MPFGTTSVMYTADEITEDIAEFKTLLSQATRQRVKDVLNTEIRKLETEVTNMKEKLAAESNQNDSGDTATKLEKPVPETRKTLPTKIIDNYGWDQTEKFMKIYITLEGVEKLAKDKVNCEFTPSTINVRLLELGGRNYDLKIVNLFKAIVPSESYSKVKTGMVIVFLKKKEPNVTWAFVTQQEKKIKDMRESKTKFDDKKDPSAGLMDLMQKMYEDGDDEMKRTINKAWAESQEKRAKGIDL